MKTTPICDYTNYDYKKDFWNGKFRDYEHVIETDLIQRLLNQFNYSKDSTILDAGCGFGRLFDCYQSYGSKFYLVDYSQTLLDQAKDSLTDTSKIEFIKSTIQEMPLNNGSVDTIISIRTLHHILNPDVFFNEIHRILKDDGIFIFNIPNKRHVLNIFRWFIGKQKNVFSNKPMVLSETFVNYHPKYIINLLKQSGFKIKYKVNTSFFRSTFLIKILPLSFLLNLDILFQTVFSFLNLAPSVFVVCQKK